MTSFQPRSCNDATGTGVGQPFAGGRGRRREGRAPAVSKPLLSATVSGEERVGGSGMRQSGAPIAGLGWAGLGADGRMDGWTQDGRTGCMYVCMYVCI